jgi:hypothetical protein
MCDSLGISDEKINVFKFTMLGQSIIYRTADEVIEAIKLEIDDNAGTFDLEFSLSRVEMKESEFENLPEFEGY